MTCLLYAVAIKEAKTETGIACIHAPRFLVPLMMNRRAEEKHTHTLPPPETLLIAKPPPEEESQKEKNTLLKLFRAKECRVWFFVAAAACLPAVGTCIERIRLFFSINPCSEYCTYSTDSPDSSKGMCQIGGM